MTLIIWSDLHSDLLASDSGLRVSLNVDAVKVSVNNILRTRLGERVMLPEFGSAFPDILFEGMTSDMQENLISSIQDAITTWEPRVKITTLKVYFDPDLHKVRIQLYLQIIGYERIFEHNVLI